MQIGQPSLTALGAARLRAAHQVLDQGVVFADPLALRILGPDADAMVRQAKADQSRRRLRWFIAMRSRIAEDALAAAAGRGVDQLVVLGAGLDTYAYRTPLAGTLRMFEVDHPATQIWKRQRLVDAAIALPTSLTFVPVDFERENLADRLAAAGFASTRASFFSWLGVVPYLSEEAIFATLGFIAWLPGSADVVFDYVRPTEAITSQPARFDREALQARVSSLGEGIQSYFDSERLGAKMAELGFRSLNDFGPAQLAARFFPGRVSSGGSAHIMHASTRS